MWRYVCLWVWLVDLLRLRSCAIINVTLLSKQDCKLYTINRGDSVFISWDGNGANCPLHNCTVYVDAFDEWYHNNKICVEYTDWNMHSQQNMLTYESDVKGPKDWHMEERGCNTFRVRIELKHNRCTTWDSFKLKVTASEEDDSPTQSSEMDDANGKVVLIIVLATLGWVLLIAIVLVIITLVTCRGKNRKSYSPEKDYRPRPYEPGDVPDEPMLVEYILPDVEIYEKDSRLFNKAPDKDNDSGIVEKDNKTPDIDSGSSENYPEIPENDTEEPYKQSLENNHITPDIVINNRNSDLSEMDDDRPDSSIFLPENDIGDNNPDTSDTMSPHRTNDSVTPVTDTEAEGPHRGRETPVRGPVISGMSVDI